jgi:hypothetical protein
MKRILLLLLSSAFAGSGLLAQSLYSSTAYASRFNPGVGSHGTPIVAYDDVSIPTSLAEGSDSISITKINVGIRRVPNAPATHVNIFYTPFQKDAPEGGVNNNALQVLLGTVSLPVNGPSLVTSVISVGDSVNTLFMIKKNANISPDAQQKFLIGASFDNPSPGNGIVLTKEENSNLDSIWVVNQDTDKKLYATSFNKQLPASYHLEVFGTGSESRVREDRSVFHDVAKNMSGNEVINR